MRQRPGDQPQPIPNDLPTMHDLVIASIEERRAIGISRYGQALQPHNGRDTLQDAIDEVLDLAVYLTSLKYERDHPQGAVPTIVAPKESNDDPTD